MGRSPHISRQSVSCSEPKHENLHEMNGWQSLSPGILTGCHDRRRTHPQRERTGIGGGDLENKESGTSNILEFLRNRQGGLAVFISVHRDTLGYCPKARDTLMLNLGGCQFHCSCALNVLKYPFECLCVHTVWPRERSPTRLPLCFQSSLPAQSGSLPCRSRFRK